MLTYRQIAEAMLGIGKHSFDEALRKMVRKPGKAGG